jgi:hypothetical protein
VKKAALAAIGLVAAAAVILAIVFIPKLMNPGEPPATTTTPPTATQAKPATTEPRFSAVLTSALGRVEVLKTGGTWNNAAVGTKLEKGDTIRTGESAAATVTFFDGSTIELKFATEIKVLELQQQANQTTITLGQQVGQTVSKVAQLLDPASRYDIETPAAFAAVRGSDMFVSVEKDGQTLVGNIEGDIRAVAAGMEVKIPQGMHSVIYPGRTPGQPRDGANPVIYRTPVMIDSTADLFDKNGNPATGAAYLDIQKAEISFAMTSLTDGEFTLRMELKEPLPEPSNTTARFIEWDFLTDLDRNPANGFQWPLIANDMGYDVLVQLGLQNGKYQARILTISSNSWQNVEYSIQGNTIEIYLEVEDLIPSLMNLITGPADMYWMVATRLYMTGDADNQPSIIDKAPNQGHYNLMP